MSMFFDYDPLTNVTTKFDFDDETQQSYLTYSQDVTAALNKAAEFRKYPERTKKGIKEDWWHYAIVPVVIQYQMLHEDGVNYWDKADEAKVLELLNTKYKAFKVTELTHALRKGR